jgi:hypothetical protein
MASDAVSVEKGANAFGELLIEGGFRGRSGVEDGSDADCAERDGAECTGAVPSGHSAIIS